MTPPPIALLGREGDGLPRFRTRLVGKIGRLTRMNHDETEAVNEKQTKEL
jgi:hypothetical protein